jgi:hypothetical protein
MITINSKDRDSTSNSSADMLFKKINFNGIRRFKIEYIQLPYSWYNISSNYNSIRINGTNTVSVTAGWYTASGLASALQTALQVVDATFTCTYSSITGKFTIARTTNFTLNLSSSLFTMRRQLGFNSLSDTAAALTHTSDSIANVHMSNSISLHSDVLSKLLRNEISDHRSDYVMSIPIDVNMGDLLVYRPHTDEWYNFKEPMDTNSITLQLKDINNNIISLNGCDYEIKIVYN